MGLSALVLIEPAAAEAGSKADSRREVAADLASATVVAIAAEERTVKRRIPASGGEPTSQN